MKRTNKIVLFAVSAVMIVSCLFAFAACEDPKPLEGTVKIYVGEDKTYTIDLQEAEMYTNNSVFDALEYIAKTDNTFTYQGSFSANQYGYGAFLSAIGTLNPNSANGEYITFFMNDESKKDVSAYALENKVVNGTTLYYSGYGISAVKLVDGLVVYFGIASYTA